MASGSIGREWVKSSEVSNVGKGPVINCGGGGGVLQNGMRVGQVKLYLYKKRGRAVKF